MGRRYLSLDLLRGLSIFGMIFSAIIPYGVLPAWMYHIQNPPPTHVLDMGVPGIGWVDLVFPVFIVAFSIFVHDRPSLTETDFIALKSSFFPVEF